MRSFVAIPAAIAVFVFPTASKWPADAADPAGAFASSVKCGSAARAPLIAFDGRISEGVQLGDVEREHIFFLEIVCMDPVDSTFSMNPGIPVVSIWTEHGPAPEMELALAEVLEAQIASHAASGEYLTDVSSLDLSEFSDRIRISMEVGKGGWLAVASIERLLARCVVFDGSIDPPHHSVTARTPRFLHRHEVRETGSPLIRSGDTSSEAAVIRRPEWHEANR